MARISELRLVYQRVGVWRFFLNLWKRIGRDNLFTWGSALAYSWLFAVFPFMIFLLTLVPYVPEQWKSGADQKVTEYIYTWLPKQAADTIWLNLREVLSKPRSGLLSVGIIVTIWAASGGMAMTMSAIDRCFAVKDCRPFYKQRPLAILLTIIVTSLIISVLVLIPVGNLATRGMVAWLAEQKIFVSTPLLWVWDLARYGLALMFMFMVLALIYYFGPSKKMAWVFWSPGAIFSVAVWLVLGFTFRFYVNKFGKYDQTYGTVGGVAVLLLFFYIDALVLLIGAEINSEIDATVRGEHPGAMEVPAKTTAV